MIVKGSINVESVAPGKKPKPILWVENSEGCHICISHTRDKGYPVIRRAGKITYIMRYLYEKKYGKIASGLVIRHSCDQPGCININHLSTGTIADNNKDRHARNFGKSNGNVFLTEDQVREIKSNPHFTLSHYAKKFGVNKTTISSIKKGKTWTHVIALVLQH